MLGLIYRYILYPNQENAAKIRIYAQKYPFELMLIAPELQKRISHILHEKQQ